MMRLVFIIVIVVSVVIRTDAQWNTTGSHIYNSNSGNVGIGTSAPDQKLHVASLNSSTFIVIEKPSSSYEAGLVFKNTSSNPTTQFYFYTDNDNNALKIQSTGVSGENDSYPRIQLPFDNGNIYMVESGGNVGIGTTSPAYKLDVYGQIRTSNDLILDLNFPLNIQRRGANADAYFLHNARTDGSNYYWETNHPSFGSRGIKFSYLEGIHFFADGVQTTSSASFTPATRFFIGNNGNVGVGTVTPAEKLHIDGAIRGNAEGGSLKISTSNGFVEVGPRNEYFSHFMTDRPNFFFDKHIFVDGTINAYNQDLVLRTADMDRITIRQATGDVGIGTVLVSNPNNYKLAVNGKIGAHEVRVEQTSATWPDYVFSEDYLLPSLTEVEKYVEQNNHLEGVPSADEVEKNGHDLGTMDALLLKKIEELTLYIIRQEKRLNSQAQEIENLKKKINSQ